MSTVHTPQLAEMTLTTQVTDVPDHVIGLDPSITSTGLVRIDRKQGGTPVISTHRVRSKGKKDDTWVMRWDRIDKLRDAVLAEVPDGSVVVIEAPAYSSTSGSMFDRTCFWRDLSRDARARGCHVFPVTPQVRMRYATGAGGGANAGKDNVLAAAIRRYPAVDITGNDIADAMLFAAIGMRLIRAPIESLPGANLKDFPRIQPEFDALMGWR